MVQLPSPRKRCAEQAAAAAVHVPPPPDVVKAEDGNVPILKRVKIVQQPALSPHVQYMHCNVLHEPGTLGLQLRKSPSLLDLIQTKLSQAKSAAEQSTMAHSTYEPPKKKEIKSGAPKSGERLKASNFPANFLKIGTWEYKSQYEGDLVAKCYFAKHKLVWEVLDAGLKSKIEIQWSDIIALKAICPEDGDGTLNMVLARPPLFFKETDPQPRKHTLWQTASDFTGGQATLHRRHILQCPTSLLSKNFEKLIQCDQRLNQLSQQPHTISVSPVFKPTNSIFESPNEVQAPLPDFTHPSSPCADSQVSKKYGLEDFILKQPQLFSQPVNLDIRANEVAPEQKLNWRNQLLVPGLKSSMSMDDLVNHLGNVVSPTRDNEPVTKEFLEEIAQCLLSDTQVPLASDEKYLMARVNSLCCLLEKDTSPATIPMPKPNDSGCTGEGVNSDGFDEELTSASGSSTADVTEQTAISRKDSLGDLLLNLPRIASVQQLFEIPENSKKSGFCFWD